MSPGVIDHPSSVLPILFSLVLQSHAVPCLCYPKANDVTCPRFSCVTQQFSLGSSTRQTLAYRGESRGGHLDGAQDRGGELSIFSLQRSRESQCLFAVCSYLVGKDRKAQFRLLMEVPRGPMASNGHKMAKKKIHLDIGKQFLHRGRLHDGPVAQRACSVSILGDTQALSGRDSEKPDLTLMSSGAWCQGICRVLHGDELGVKRSCCRHALICS